MRYPSPIRVATRFLQAAMKETRASLFNVRHRVLPKMRGTQFEFGKHSFEDKSGVRHYSYPFTSKARDKWQHMGGNWHYPKDEITFLFAVGGNNGGLIYDKIILTYTDPKTEDQKSVTLKVKGVELADVSRAIRPALKAVKDGYEWGLKNPPWDADANWG